MISYGATPGEGSRVAGGYVGRILKGEKPADLPVQQSTKVELIVSEGNLAALHYDRWKILFLEQRAEGLDVWQDPLVPLA